MSVFVILALLVCIEAQGTRVTPVFVQTGDDLLLNVDDVPEDYLAVDWKVNQTVDLVRFALGGEPIVSPDFTGRIEFPVKNFSVKLKNVQKADSGVYTAVVMGKGDQQLAEYKVTVQDPVSPVKLSVVSLVSRSSASCDLTVTCSTQDSHISSTFKCVNRTCRQEGGEQAEVTTSGASLQVYLLNSSIICHHSNQVNGTKDFKMIKHFCPLYAGMPPYFPMSQLCKFCDVELSSCSGTGTCMSNCFITSICMDSHEVCVSLWRKKETDFSVETLCHDPSKPLYGVMLDDYNSSTCVMKEKNTTSGMAHVCSCTDVECNDQLLFTPGECTVKLTPSPEGSEAPSAGTSVYLLKIGVFSVGLIIYSCITDLMLHH